MQHPGGNLVEEGLRFSDVVIDRAPRNTGRVCQIADGNFTSTSLGEQSASIATTAVIDDTSASGADPIRRR